MSPAVILIIFGGMGAITGDSGYGGDVPPIEMLAPALITLLLTLTLGVAGYIHKDLIPPLLFWGMTALTGVLGWNSED
jgi:hypothetical protein